VLIFEGTTLTALLSANMRVPPADDFFLQLGFPKLPGTCFSLVVIRKELSSSRF